MTTNNKGGRIKVEREKRQREKVRDIGVIVEREMTRVSNARWSVLLMRAECSANRVALVRTRSINEIKTDLKEQRSFRSIASLQLASRSVGWLVGLTWWINRGIISRRSTRRLGWLCHTIILSFMFLCYIYTCSFVYFVRA